MSNTSGGDGWWQASDGKWYPPESHPAYTPTPPPPPPAGAPLPAPTPAFGAPAAGTTPGTSPIVESPTPFWKRWWVIAIGVIVVIGVVGAIVGSGGGGDDDEDAVVVLDTVPEDDPEEEPTEETTPDEPETTDASVTSEPADTAPPTTEAPADAGLSLDSPARVGEVAQVGDWAIRVTAVTPDAADVILAENQFNDPPAPGQQFFMATLEATYTGDESSTFWLEVMLKSIGPSSVAYEGFDASCGVLPDDLDSAGEAFPGGTITGNVCWAIDPADAAEMVLIAEPGFSFDGDDRRFLSMDPAAEVMEGSTAAGAPTPQAIEGVPMGEAVEVGDWTITVLATTPDAGAAILAENQFNDPPKPGHQFFMATLEATYNGSESSTFWIDTSLKAVGPRAVAYEGFDATCGVLPDDIDNAGETFPGGTITGNVCWSIDAFDSAALTMLASPLFAFDAEPEALSLAN